MAPSSEYRASRLKLLIVGQQTRGWGSTRNLHDQQNYPVAKSVQADYSGFALGQKWRSPFFQGARSLRKALNISQFGFLWTNLLICDQHTGTAQIDFREVLRNYSPLRAELTQLNPDVVIFFTGASMTTSSKICFPGCRSRRSVCLRNSFIA